jgi:hypothetical protein
VAVAVVVGVGGVGVEEAMVVAALWAVPLASVPSRSDRVARVCGGTVNVGSRAPACPPFNIALRERGLTAIQGKRPRSGRGSDWFPNPEITFLTFPPLISISHLNSTIHLFTNQCIGHTAS